MAGKTLYSGQALAVVNGSSGADHILASQECASIWEFRLLWIGEIQVISSHGEWSKCGVKIDLDPVRSSKVCSSACSSEIHSYILVFTIYLVNLYASEIRLRGDPWLVDSMIQLPTSWLSTGQL